MTDVRTEHVLTAVDGALGHITLNRPRAMNALTLDMVRAIDATLIAWEDDPAVAVVLLDGAGDRGLCAGGDIVALHDSAKRRDGLAQEFWRDEYVLDARIARYPKPFVAIMDGVVMGGGVGLSAHASHRVASERLATAMPEVGIGFAPDVGGTYLLSRTPGELGTHLALTGERIGARDAILCGLADRVLAASDVAALVDGLRDGDVDVALARATRAGMTIPEARLVRDRVWIDACYASDDVEEILDRLRARSEPEAAAAADALASKSPTSLRVTLRALRSARDLPTLEACLDQEYRISCAFLETPDFVEGIRAAVIDKDRSPRWRPPRLADVVTAEVDRHFAALDRGELGLADEVTA
jgi:enoyl-CoA hydratase